MQAKQQMTLKQRIDYLHDLRKMYEKSVRVHGADSRQAAATGDVLYMGLGFLRGKLAAHLNESARVEA